MYMLDVFSLNITFSHLNKTEHDQKPFGARDLRRVKTYGRHSLVSSAVVCDQSRSPKCQQILYKRFLVSPVDHSLLESTRRNMIRIAIVVK